MKRIIQDGEILKAYYYQYPNFGDLLNETIVRDHFGIPMEFTEFSDAEVILLGSMLDKLLDHGKVGKRFKEVQLLADKEHPIHVWGTGLMFRYEENTEQNPVRPLIIEALRGELTRAQMSAFLKEEISCVLADPGLLASRIVPAEEKRWEVGIIPHYVDAENPVFQKMLTYYPNPHLIDVHEDPKAVLRQISQCRTVLSTSLHGIIVADAYNAPNCWCEASDRILGEGYKYHDYFSSFGTDREPFDLRKGSLPDPGKDCRTNFSSYTEVKRKQRELESCFPFRKPTLGNRIFQELRGLFGQK